jgi:hypothetical protein
LDKVAQELAWVLLPAFTPAESALRTIVEEFQSVTTELERTGMAIAPHARGAYRELRSGNIALRLYAVTWTLTDPAQPLDQPPEWTLLLILGAQPGMTLPANVGLKIQDQTQVLVNQVQTAENQDSYLYTRVVGTWEEQFWVTINLGNGAVITLPPFALKPD